MNGQVNCEGPSHFIQPFNFDESQFANGNVAPASIKKHMAYLKTNISKIGLCNFVSYALAQARYLHHCYYGTPLT